MEATATATVFPETAHYSHAKATEVDEGFSARFSATARAYRYRILAGPAADPLRRHTTWHVSWDLDVDRMDRAAREFVGAHDFAAFCRQREGAGTERTVFDAGWSMEDDLTVFSIRAKAFCHQMVRSITGFCVDVGRNKVAPDSVAEVLASGDRSRSRQMAPAHGLILWAVEYGANGERRTADS